MSGGESADGRERGVVGSTRVYPSEVALKVMLSTGHLPDELEKRHLWFGGQGEEPLEGLLWNLGTTSFGMPRLFKL